MLTVRDLITVLQTMDPDLPVICQRYSDFQAQEAPEVVKIIDLGAHKDHTGRWIRYYPEQWKDTIQRPNVVQACFFEGN